MQAYVMANIILRSMGGAPYRPYTTILQRIKKKHKIRK